MKYKILLLFAWHFVLIADAQSDLENHKKYWFYRSRLLNDFIKIGATPTLFSSSVMQNPPTHRVYSNPEGHGESIPFCERVYEEALPYSSSAGSQPSDQLRTGDATVQLGIYISVLATEFKLLQNNSQDLSTIKHELFCALNAINRLDFFAEPILDSTKAPSLNGFFVRDDIPGDFVINNYEHFNYFIGNPANPHNVVGSPDFAAHGFTQDQPFVSMTETLSDYRTSGNLSGPEMSQDQLYYLMMGLTLVSKLVPTATTDGSNVFQYEPGSITGLREEAKLIAARLIQNLKTSHWIIKNPNTGNTITGLGPNAMAYAYALDNLADFIVFDETLPSLYFSTPNFTYPYNSHTDFRDLSSPSLPLNTISTLYQGLVLSGGGPTNDMQGFFNCLGGCGNNAYTPFSVIDLAIQNKIQDVNVAIAQILQYGYIGLAGIISGLGQNSPPWLGTLIANTNASSVSALLNSLHSLRVQLMSNLYKQMMGNSSDERLLSNNNGNLVSFSTCINPTGPPAWHTGAKEFFGIYIRQILHASNATLPGGFQFINSGGPFFLSQGAHSVVQSDLRTILDAAPCEGNFNFGPVNSSIPYSGEPLSNEWGTENRIDRCTPVFDLQINNCHGRLGLYNGLDYMLLHNLFYLSEGTTEAITDFIRREIHSNLPIGALFSTTNKSTFGSFEFIFADNRITSTGGAFYRAGKEIHFSDGFSAELGCDLDAIIDPFTCSGISFSMNRSSFENSEPFKTLTSFNGNETGFINSYPSANTGTFSNEPKISDATPRNISPIPEPIVFSTNIYPNPSDGKVVVTCTGLDSRKIKIVIINTVGQEILYKDNIVEGSTNCDLSTFPSGIYILQLITSKGEIISKRINKQ